MRRILEFQVKNDEPRGPLNVVSFTAFSGNEFDGRVRACTLSPTYDACAETGRRAARTGQDAEARRKRGGILEAVMDTVKLVSPTTECVLRCSSRRKTMTPQALIERSLGMADFSARELADTVERYVRLRTGGTISSLHVEVSQSEVILSGRTSTYYNKQLATHAALDAASEISLTNEIEVC
jgi:hypothetical protein